MIETAITAFGGGSLITAVVTIFVRLMDKRAEMREREAAMDTRNREIDFEVSKEIMRATNNLWGNGVRFILAVVPQIIMLALLWIGYHNPDVVIWYGQKQEPEQVSLLFGFFEYTSKPETTWREFSGIVVLPALFVQMGAVNTYYLISGMFSRR